MHPCCATCSATRLPCDCCTGTTVLTPTAIHNRPGLPALGYRVGTHGSFLESMKARLATMEVDGVAADGQTPRSFRPLQALGTRDPGDFSIALLDGWATVANLLSFYQERIANEGYLRTATERRSVLELARLVGYTLRPGVAASVHLAYTLDDNQAEPTVIGAGARAQSLPGPGETPQTFETSEDLEARRDWNNLQVRLTRPQNISLATALQIDRVFVSGAVNALRAGDPLLLLFSEDGSLAALRGIRSTEGPDVDGRSIVHLDPVPPPVAATIALLVASAAAMQAHLPNAKKSTKLVIDNAWNLLRAALLDPASADPMAWPEIIQNDTSRNRIDADVLALIDELAGNIKNALGAPPSAPAPTTSPDRFVHALLKERVPQARNSLQLRRGLGPAFARGADTAPQLLLRLAPALQDSYYRAWAGADQAAATAPLVGAFALRTSASLFGASVPRQATYANGTVDPPSKWREWTLQEDETTNGLYLDQPHPEIAAGSYVVLRNASGDRGAPKAQVLRIEDAAATPRSAYGISGQSTHLRLARDWWQVRRPNADGVGTNDMAVLRATQVWAQSTPLTLAEEPIADDVGSRPGDGDNLGIELAALHRDLRSGRWVILQGERADIEGVRGVQAAELMMVASLVHGFDPDMPGDHVHTTLRLATRSAFRYRRDSLVIYGNVVRATHGETHRELLGSGDATATLQRFTLKQQPLTFVPAPTAAGAESTLAAYVDDLRWHQAPSLAWLGARDRGFVTRTDDAGQTTLIFGDGAHGARLPTGVQNVRAVYRSGMGAAGNVAAQQISLLTTRPLGVREVINPLRASGGADREDRDLARSNAPLAVAALDRLVSVSDYADFARTFAGIAKAVVTRTSEGARELVLLTIAGVDDAPIDASSDLYRNLLSALRDLGDPDLPVRVLTRELLTLVLQARVALLPDHAWEPVAAATRSALLQQFGFGARALGQGVHLAEVISTIQGMAGVAHVDVDAFGAIPEKRTTPDGTRQLLTQGQISDTVNQLLHGDALQAEPRRGLAAGLPPDVSAFPGGADGGLLRPAELAVFVPAIADTLILNPWS